MAEQRTVLAGLVETGDRCAEGVQRTLLGVVATPPWVLVMTGTTSMP
jgi:hypothetical protein